MFSSFKLYFTIIFKKILVFKKIYFLILKIIILVLKKINQLVKNMVLEENNYILSYSKNLGF